MDQQYSAEEREKQIEGLENLRRKKKHGKKWRELRPRSLLRAMAVQDVVSTEHIKKIVDKEYSDPVVSLYLDLDADKMAPEKKSVLRSFHSLKTRAFDERKDFIESLSQSQKQALTHDIDEIEAFLADYFVPETLRSLVIFKSGEILNKVIRLWVRTSDRLVIDPDPYVMPLEAAFEDNEKVLFVETSKQESRFLLYHLGHCEQVERIQSFVPSDTVDASIPGHAQRHRLNHLQWHLKHTADAAYHFYNDRSCNALVFMAERRVAALLDEYLHQSLKPRIINWIYDSPDADTRDRKELIESTIRDHRTVRETKAIEDLANYKPGEELLSSLDDVIAACNLFLAYRLLVNEGLREKGFVCRGHHYISLNDTECPFDDTKMLAVENVLDELVEMTRLHGVNVMIIEHRQDLMAKYDGIAALQYHSSVPA
jgi:hypothetical protein